MKFRLFLDKLLTDGYLPVFQLWPEVPDKSLDWPGSAISKSTDGVALNLDLEVLLNSFKQEACSTEIKCLQDHIIILLVKVEFTCLLSSQIISISSGCALPSVNLHIIVFIQSMPWSWFHCKDQKRSFHIHEDFPPNCVILCSSLTSLHGVHWPHDSCL